MTTLLFVTNNLHKLDEVRQKVGETFHIKSLKELGLDQEIPETQPTLDGNALQKARFIYEQRPMDCFADDTGLEVEALDGRPGVYSARYAGPGCTPEDNINKLLGELGGQTNRKARFRTVIALILGGKEYVFEGKVDGIITTTRSGSSGFGYDPVFQPEGYELTFAEMPMEQKNGISHRGRATDALAEFLRNS